MKFIHKIRLSISALAIAAVIPFNALAAVKLGFYGETRVYGVSTVFDKYITFNATGDDLIKNHATVKMVLENGSFAKDKNGNYIPVYLTDSNKMLTREEMDKMLTDGTLKGMAFLPTSDDTVSVTFPQGMIDKYGQIMFSASAVEYGDVSISLEDNRDIEFIVKENEARDNHVYEEGIDMESVKITVGSSVIYSGDNDIEIDMPAFISSNGYVKIPLRAVAEIFGSDIYWNGAEDTINISDDKNKIVMTVGSNRMYVNDYATALVSAPEISNGRTFIALRDLGKVFDIQNIEWDEETKSVSFDYYK